VLVLILAVIAAGVVWWKVIASGGPSRHRTVSESSMPIGPSEIEIQTRARDEPHVISSGIIWGQAQATESSIQPGMSARSA
jgi:hypothetical protein